MKEPWMALEYARQYREAFGTEHRIEQLPPRIQYAVRRIGGLGHLEREWEFVQAFNDAPFVDEWFWDLDVGTVEFVREVVEEEYAREIGRRYEREMRGVQVGVPGNLSFAGRYGQREDANRVRDLCAGDLQPITAAIPDGVYRDVGGEVSAIGDPLAAAASGIEAGGAAGEPECHESWLRELWEWIERRFRGMER